MYAVIITAMPTADTASSASSRRVISRTPERLRLEERQHEASVEIVVDGDEDGKKEGGYEEPDPDKCHGITSRRS